MKNSSADKRGRVRSLWQPNSTADLSDVTVPVYLAFCMIVSCTRHHVGTKSSGLVILQVPDPDSVETFVQAGRILLRKVLAQRDRSDPFVRGLGSKRDKLSEYEIFRRAAEDGKGMLFCTDLDEVSEELKFFADLTATLPRPTRRQIRATFRQFRRELAEAEVDLVGRESWARLIYAFPQDRPIEKGLRRLREFSQAVTSAQWVATQSLECLHGYGEAREWGLELARDIRDYKNGLIGWDDVDAGLLLSGPPGTGKTLFAEALANTCQIPVVVTSAAEWQAAGYLSDLLKAMRAAFAEAAAKAPCLLFLDEVDSFGSRAIADSQNADYKRQVINGLIEQLDGFGRRSGVVVIGATNYPENLDPAIVRPGRLDRHIAIATPDGRARRLIFEQMSGLKIPASEEVRFERTTVSMTGASIKQMVRDAKRVARRRDEILAIDHVLSVAPQLEKVPDAMRRVAAVHEAGHALVGIELGLALDGVLISQDVTRDQRSTLGGAVFKNEAFASQTKTVCLNHLTLLMGGIAAEQIHFGEFEAGAVDVTSDLAKATALATQIEACFGFGDTLVVEVLPVEELARLRSANPPLRAAVQRRLDDAMRNATTILEANARFLSAIAGKLERHNYLSSDDIYGIMRQSKEILRADDGDVHDPQVHQVVLDANDLDEDTTKREIENAMRRWGMLQ